MFFHFCRMRRKYFTYIETVFICPTCKTHVACVANVVQPSILICPPIICSTTKFYVRYATIAYEKGDALSLLLHVLLPFLTFYVCASRELSLEKSICLLGCLFHRSVLRSDSIFASFWVFCAYKTFCLAELRCELVSERNDSRYEQFDTSPETIKQVACSL